MAVKLMKRRKVILGGRKSVNWRRDCQLLEFLLLPECPSQTLKRLHCPFQPPSRYTPAAA